MVLAGLDRAHAEHEALRLVPAGQAHGSGHHRRLLDERGPEWQADEGRHRERPALRERLEILGRRLRDHEQDVGRAECSCEVRHGVDAVVLRHLGRREVVHSEHDSETDPLPALGEILEVAVDPVDTDGAVRGLA